MGIKEMRWIFLTLLAVVMILGFLSHPVSLGVSEEWSNGNYRFAGGTHPLALLLSIVILGLYVLLMFSPSPTLGDPLPGVFRRFIAFWLDFILAMLMIGPALGVLPVLTESKRTGHFQWSFERTTYASGDGWLVWTGIALCAAALISYYAFPLFRGRPSPGACIVGYQVLRDDGTTMRPRMALLRTLLGFVAVSGLYFAPFIARDRKKGKFWLDKVFHTRAVRLI